MYSTSGLSGTKGPINPSNAGTLTLSEYQRMKDRILSGPLSEDQEQRQREKQDLQEKSNARVKNWPNTIQALRKKKDDARFEKFQKDEEERRKIDEEEAAYQAEIKKQILEKANKQIYDTQDRVKKFQSALLLADTLQEREEQIEISKRKKEISHMIEAKHYEMEQENMRLYDQKEIEKREIAEKKKKEAQKILQEQHKEFKLRYLKRLQEERIEGEIVKIKAKEELQKQKEEDQRRRQRVIDAQAETRKGNEQLQEIRRQERLKELQKEKEIEEFAKKKEEILEMRRIREEMKFNEKQAARQKIIDKQVEELRKLKSKEDEILNKQIKEAEIKAEENERIKREKRDELKRTIDHHQALSMAKRKQEKEQEIIDAKEFQQFWAKKNQELHQKDLEEKKNYKERCRLLAEHHKKAAEQKQRLLEEEIYKEFDEADKIKKTLKEEEEYFKSYASRALNEWDSNGKNIQPLLIELRKMKLQA